MKGFFILTLPLESSRYYCHVKNNNFIKFLLDLFSYFSVR